MLPPDNTIIVAVCERGEHVQVQRPGDPPHSRYCGPCDNAPGRQRGSRSLEMVPRTYVAVDALLARPAREAAARQQWSQHAPRAEWNGHAITSATAIVKAAIEVTMSREATNA